MNREQQAQHIGELFLSQAEGKEIIYSDGAQAGEVSCLSAADVIQHPERYSIKKDPRTVDITIERDMDGNMVHAFLTHGSEVKIVVGQTRIQRKDFTFTLEE